MAITASMRQVAQLGFETTYGTPVAAIKRPTSFGLAVSPNQGVAVQTPRGQTAPTGGWVSREDSTLSIDNGVLSFDECIIPLQSVVTTVTPTTVGATGRQWVYGANQFAADTPQIYTTESGAPGASARAYQVAGTVFTEWGFSVSSADDQIAMTGSALGGKMTAMGSGMTSGLSGSAISNFQPITPLMLGGTNGVVGYSTTAAGLGTPTAISHAFSASFGITSRRDLVRYLGNATGAPNDTVETAPGITFDLSIADEAAPIDTLLTSLRAGTKLFFRIKFADPVNNAGTAIPYSFQLDVATLLRDSISLDDSGGVQSITLPLDCVYDGTWGNIFQITVVNQKAVAMP